MYSRTGTSLDMAQQLGLEPHTLKNSVYTQLYLLYLYIYYIIYKYIYHDDGSICAKYCQAYCKLTPTTLDDFYVG